MYKRPELLHPRRPGLKHNGVLLAKQLCLVGTAAVVRLEPEQAVDHWTHEPPESPVPLHSVGGRRNRFVWLTVADQDVQELVEGEGETQEVVQGASHVIASTAGIVVAA